MIVELLVEGSMLVRPVGALVEVALCEQLQLTFFIGHGGGLKLTKNQFWVACNETADLQMCWLRRG